MRKKRRLRFLGAAATHLTKLLGLRDAKRNLEAQLSGKAPATDAQPGQTITQAVDVFLQDKKNQDVTAKVLAKYTRELARLRGYCERRGIFVVSGLTKELLTGYASTWPELYPLVPALGSGTGCLRFFGTATKRNGYPASRGYRRSRFNRRRLCRLLLKSMPTC